MICFSQETLKSGTMYTDVGIDSTCNINCCSHCNPFYVSELVLIWHLHRRVDSRVNVHILASTNVPFTLTTVQVPNLAPIHKKRITVLSRRNDGPKTGLFADNVE
jgi:hypothetical protein